MSFSGGTISLADRFGIRGKSFADMNTPDFIGSQLGWTIGQFQARFPNYHYVLDTVLGWTDPEILGLTYFTAAYNEAGFLQYESGAGFPYSRFDISIPAGKHWYNSELRMPQGTTSGNGAFHYFGFGGTEVCLTKTNWKSIYGSQNNGTYLGFCPWTYAGESGTSTNPIATGGGYDWCHNTRVTNMCMTGTSAAGFNVNTERQAGVMYSWPGENSGVYNCLFTEYNDFGILISGSPAYANCMDNSFFRNAVAGIGIRGCSRSTINLSFSGDFNPWSVCVFRQGDSSAWSPNGVSFWPHFQNTNPGGDITMQYVKLEAFACRSGYHSYSACTPNIIGKGQNLARLTGRFMFGVEGGGARVHGGAVNTLITVIDDYFQVGGSVSGVPLDNSCIDVRDFHTVSMGYWMHDVNRNKKWIANPNDTDTQGSGFTWRNNQNSGNCYDVSNPSILLGSTAAAYQFRQPFSNASNPITWNETTGPSAGDGYNEITGANY